MRPRIVAPAISFRSLPFARFRLEFLAMRVWRGDFRDLFHTFRIALDLRKMSLAFIGLALSAAACACLFVLFTLFSDRQAVAAGELARDEAFGAKVEKREWMLAAGRVRGFMARHLGSFRPAARAACAPGLRRCPLRPSACSACSGCCPLPKTRVGWLALACCGLLTWLIFARLAGAITRIAAVEIAQDERIEIAEAMRYASENHRAYFWAPVSVLLGIGFSRPATWPAGSSCAA